MRERAKGLEWIKADNKAQVKWAIDYLKKKKRPEASSAIPEPVTYEELQDEGLELERTAAGVLILQAMRAAWRQREYRQPEHGRQPYTFTLLIETKNQLSEQAKKCGHGEAEHLTALIKYGHQEAINTSKWMREQQAKARKDLPKAKAEAVFQQLWAQELKKHLEQCLKDRFAAENVASEELEQKVEREMDRINQEILRVMAEQQSTNPRLKHLGL